MICPFCKQDLEGALVSCRECGTQQHRECAEDHGRCTVLGCEHRRFEPPLRRRRTARGSLARRAQAQRRLEERRWRRWHREALAVATAPWEGTTVLVLGVLGLGALVLIQA